jgi:hypothetical protein
MLSRLCHSLPLEQWKDAVTEPTDGQSAIRRLARFAHPCDSLSRRDLLKAGVLGVLTGLGSHSTARAMQGADRTGDELGPVPLVFDEPADRPAGSIPWPVTVGVPFANGALESLNGLTISAGESPVPAQFTKVIDWRFGAKTISWVHCDFQTRLGGRDKPGATLHDSRQANPEPAHAVTVVEDETHYTVDTGAVTFTCSKTAFNLFDSLVAGNTPVVRSSSLYWKATACPSRFRRTRAKPGPLNGPQNLGQQPFGLPALVPTHLASWWKLGNRRRFARPAPLAEGTNQLLRAL